MTDQPMNYEINVKPIFVKDGVEYPFEGLSEDEGGDGSSVYRGAPVEYKFIVNTLRFVFGDAIDFKAGYNNGTLVIARLSNAQLKILKDIREDTCDVPVKYGQSQLRFEIGSHYYDQPPCDQNCDCCECLGCCGYEKN
jgi:hypothetical protein